MASESLTALAAAYLLVNAAALVMFYMDKRAAVRKQRRIPERTLLAASAIGPVGALAAMRVFHHKTRKTKFLLVYLFLGAHLFLLAYLFSPTVRDIVWSAL
jgi:uncharacterized membrane protein YsdA (DUF1294 family)